MYVLTKSDNQDTALYDLHKKGFGGKLTPVGELSYQGTSVNETERNIARIMKEQAQPHQQAQLAKLFQETTTNEGIQKIKATAYQSFARKLLENLNSDLIALEEMNKDTPLAFGYTECGTLCQGFTGETRKQILRKNSTEQEALNATTFTIFDAEDQKLIDIRVLAPNEGDKDTFEAAIQRTIYDLSNPDFDFRTLMQPMPKTP